MKMRIPFAALIALSLAFTAFAGDEKPPVLDAATIEAMIGPAGMPNEAHKKLDAFVGTWDTKMSFWARPGVEAVTMEGIAETRWIMGGRYLEQKVTGNFSGIPYEAVVYTGYDNVKKQYWSTYIDNTSTGLFVTTGTADGNTWSYGGSMADPRTGKDVRIETKVTVTDADHNTAVGWMPGRDGKMFRAMETVSSRRK